MGSYSSCCFVIYSFHSSYTWRKIKKILFSGGNSSELRSALWKEPGGLLIILLMAYETGPQRTSSAWFITCSALCPAQRPGEHESCKPACSRLQASPLAQQQHPGKVALVWFAWRRCVCWCLSKADSSRGDCGPREPASDHTGASEGKHSWHHPSAASVPNLCPMPQSTGSNHGMQRAGSDNGC